MFNNFDVISYNEKSDFALMKMPTFNNFDLSDQEILKIIEDYKNLINKNSMVSGRFDEDLQQEIKLLIFKVLSKNRKK